MDQTGRLVEQVKEACENTRPLRIRGSGSKHFYGNPIVATVLDVSDHHGVLSYEPSELVLTVRAGTKVSQIEELLSDSGQMLGFEPPGFGADATIGGTVACGLSGPRRPFVGSVRDFVLGIKCINGKGEYLSFGGQVIKNVAGYDISRLMVGALGSLGVLCEISMKVLPNSEHEVTFVREADESFACEEIIRLAGLPDFYDESFPGISEGSSFGNWPDSRFSALTAPALNIHRRLKEAFDSSGKLNPNIMYKGFLNS